MRAPFRTAARASRLMGRLRQWIGRAFLRGAASDMRRAADMNDRAADAEDERDRRREESGRDQRRPE